MRCLHSVLFSFSGMMTGYDNLNLPERARQSCQDLQEKAKGSLPAWFDASAASVLAQKLDRKAVQEFGTTLATTENQTRMSGTFSSQQNEAGLIVLMHALDFGGGWRQELHAWHKKGAFATVKPGVEALYEANPTLSTKWLNQVTDLSVAGYFGLSGAKELEPFVALLTKVCNEVGRALGEDNYETLGDYIETQVERLKDMEYPAALLTKDMVTRFPFTFNDVHNVGNDPVYFYKKAQLVVGELSHRFQDEDVRYKFKDQSRLTAFIDNVIVAVLRKHKVVVTDETLARRIESHAALPSGGPEEVSLRAAAMAGTEAVARELQLDPCTAGNYFWGYLGKQPDHRPYTRHATKDTVFY